MFVINVLMILHVRVKWLQQLTLKKLKVTIKKIVIKTDFHQSFTFTPDTGEFKDREISVALASNFIFIIVGKKWIMS